MAGAIPYTAPASHAYQSYQHQLSRKTCSLTQNHARRKRNHAKFKVNAGFTDGQNQTGLLQSYLESQGNQPSKEDDELRLQVLNDLEILLNRWVTSIRPFQSKNHVSSQSNMKWARPKVCLIPFGSYRLGVHRKDADLDCLCLAPPSTSRGEFFSSLIKLLEEDDRVEQVHAIASAYTPIIKFVFQGLHLDLLFARLEDGTKLAHHQSLLDGRRVEYTIDDADLIGLDEASVRSLNGARVAQALLDQVPNVITFRITLRAVKEWALAHGLYSNVLGFLGGVNFAILVALICKRHDKNSTPPALLKAFFSTYARWKWPKPVTLVNNTYQPPQGVLPMTVWNAKTNARDAQCLMPILTPCFPSMNSSYNVGVPQKRRMQIEFTVAARIVEGIEKNEQVWNDLFKGNIFFNKHLYFLQVTISADNSTSFLEWFRFCESRLRLLIAGLEAPDYGIRVFPFAKFFDKRFDDKGHYLGVGKSESNNRHESSLFMGLRFAPNVETVDLRYCTAEFLHKVNTWECRQKGMDLTIELSRREDLPSFVKCKPVTLAILSEDALNSQTPVTGENNENSFVSKETVEPECVNETPSPSATEIMGGVLVKESASFTKSREEEQGIENAATTETNEVPEQAVAETEGTNDTAQVEKSRDTDKTSPCETSHGEERLEGQRSDGTNRGKSEDDQVSEINARDEDVERDDAQRAETIPSKEAKMTQSPIEASMLPSLPIANEGPRKLERNYAAVLLHGASPSKRPRT